MFLIGNGTLITHNSNDMLINNGAVVVDADKIIDYGKTGDMKAAYPTAEFIDADGKVIMPGLINAHTHIYSSLARGMIEKNPKVSHNFTEVLENFWWKVDEGLTLEDIKYSAYLTYIDSIKRGVTTVFDHHAGFGEINGSLRTIADVAKEIGMRTSLCFEVSDRCGEDKAMQSVNENADFIQYAKKENSDMLHAMFGMHASFTISDKTMNACRKVSDGAGFHIHVAEGMTDVYNCLKEHGKRVVNRLHDFDILGENSFAVHCIHVSSSEMDILKETNTTIIHNPQSNMGNAVGCSPAIEFMARGILEGLGTDAYTHDMLESMKTVNILHKHNIGDPSVAWGEPPQMLFVNNKKIAEHAFKTKLGTIEKDHKADLIIMDYSPITPMMAENMNGHIHFGFTGANVDSTMINGKWVMRNRNLVALDEKEIFAKSRELAQNLWNRL